MFILFSFLTLKPFLVSVVHFIASIRNDVYFYILMNQSVVTKVGNVKRSGLSFKNKQQEKLCKTRFDSRNVLYYTVNQYACHVDFYRKFTESC